MRILTAREQAEMLSPWRTAMPSWYHVSPHELDVGTELTPGGGKSAFEDSYAKGHLEPERQNHVWIDSEERAPGWMGDHAYRVEPTHEPKLWNKNAPDEGWVTPSAHIVEKMPPTWLDEMAQKYEERD